MKAQSAGQTLVEVVVAVGVVVLLVTGVIVATTTSLRNGQAGRTRSLAVQYAQEGIERTRDRRNNGWSEFQDLSGLWCLDKNSIWTPAVGGICSVNIDGSFTRSVTLAWDPDNERMGVSVIVAWIESGQAKSTTIETYLTNWQ